MQIWEKLNDEVGYEIGGYVQAFYAHETNIVAYYIRHKDDILIPVVNNQRDDFKGIFEPLKNNYGVYFLLGDESNQGGKKTIYVGQASEREDTKGMDRLKEHMDRNRPDRYVDRWESAIYITSSSNDWSSGVLNTLEKLFISIYDADNRYTLLNNKPGKDGNVPEKEYAFKTIIIAKLLELQLFGYQINRTKMAEFSSKLADAFYEDMRTLMLQAKEEVEKELIGTRTSEDTKRIEWATRVDLYDNFKKKLTDADNYVFEGRVYFGNSGDSEVLTQNIDTASDIVGIIPKEKFSSRTRFLDIYTKSGSFLIALIRRFMTEDDLPIYKETGFENNRRAVLNHIVQYQLFGICNTLELYLIVNKQLLKEIENQVRVIHGDELSIKDSNLILPNIKLLKNFRDKVKKQSKDLEYEVISAFKTESESCVDMKFDVVLGNPPYNDDLYLDFVKLGCKLAYDSVCMITPAKWTSKGGGQEF